MAMVEILSGRLYQSEADPQIFSTLRDRGLASALVVDLHGLSALEGGGDASLAYLRWPIVDGPVPNVALLNGVERFASTVIAHGSTVVTMCSMGLNRSGLLSALIVARVEGMPGNEAIRFVRSKCHNALRNESFVEFIQRER